MKNTIKLFTLLIFISILSCDNANKQTEKDIEMYSSVWDDIMNKGELDKINNTYFDENITLITYPENVVGIEDFKAYYSNFITGFSDGNFTVIDVSQNEMQLQQIDIDGTVVDTYVIPRQADDVD